MKHCVAGLVLASLLLIGGCGPSADEELNTSVRTSIEAKMADAFKTRGIEVQALALAHQQAERYEGELLVLEQGQERRYRVEVQFDGTYFLWKMPDWKP